MKTSTRAWLAGVILATGIGGAAAAAALGPHPTTVSGPATVRVVTVTTPPTTVTVTATPVIRALAPCLAEDGSTPGQAFPCRWDAATQGNGRGESYVLAEPATCAYARAQGPAAGCP